MRAPTGPAGFTVRLTLFTAAAMAFLAVFALALSLAAGRLADSWGEALARSSTVRISAPVGQVATQTEAALRLLQQASLQLPSDLTQADRFVNQRHFVAS